jgi:hypothetical protein
VAGAEDPQPRRRGLLLEEHRHAAAAAHAEVVREVRLDGLRLGGRSGEERVRRLDDLLLDGAAAHRAAQLAALDHHHLRAGLLRRGALGGDDGAQHEAPALGGQASDVVEAARPAMSSNSVLTP